MGAVQVKKPEALMLEVEVDLGESVRRVEVQELEDQACA